MNVDLSTKILASPEGEPSFPACDILKRALFNLQVQNGQLDTDPRDLYEKLQPEQVDFKSEEIVLLKKAVKNQYIQGVVWQIEDLLEGTDATDS